MKRVTHLITSILLVATALPANAIENGIDVSGNAIVVQMTANTSSKTSISCSGALIAPSIVATAGHCVLDVNGLVAKDIWVGNPGAPLDFNSLTADQMVSSVQITSTFKNGIGSTVGNDDVVFLILKTPRSLSIPIRLPSEAEIQSFKSSATPLKLMGYGYTSNSAANSSSTPFSLEATFGSEQYSQVDSANANSTKGGVCSGDSGGPVLVSTANELILVGVITGAQLGGGHCSVKALNGYYQTQFTIMSRYSNLAFAAAATALKDKDSSITSLNQLNQTLKLANYQYMSQIDALSA